jgi:hypothetical protein
MLFKKVPSSYFLLWNGIQLWWTVVLNNRNGFRWQNAIFDTAWGQICINETFSFSRIKRFRVKVFVRNLNWNSGKRFSAKPSIQNLYHTYSRRVWYETFGTKPLFELFRKGSVRNLTFYETKKGSSRVSRARTFLGLVKNLFYFRCNVASSDTEPTWWWSLKQGSKRVVWCFESIHWNSPTPSANHLMRL